MNLQQTIDEIRENFTFFNKPKGALYRAVRFTAQKNCLAEYDALVKVFENCCAGTPEIPRLFIRDGLRLIAIADFKQSHAVYRTHCSDLFKGADRAFILYSGISEATQRYFQNQKKIEGELQLKFNDIRVPLVEKACSSLGQLARILTNGEIVCKTMIGNCGDCCDLVSYRLLKCKSSERIQVMQVNLWMGEHKVLSHCFTLVGATSLFSSNLEGLNKAVVVDAWNVYAMPFQELIKDTTPQTELMRFIFSEIDAFQAQSHFDSFMESRIDLESMKPLTLLQNQMKSLCLIANELKGLN